MRTKKPLDLHLAQPMWKLLAGMNLTSEDLEEVDLMAMRTLYSIRDVHKTDITEDDFSEVNVLELSKLENLNGNGLYKALLTRSNSTTNTLLTGHFLDTCNVCAVLT